MDDLFAQYYEDLLRSQYQVSEFVQQKLPRGTIREDFLKDLVLKRKESIRGKKGIVSFDGTQSGECDLIFHDISATITPLGEQILIEPKHCKLILEVKSNATGNDIKKTNDNFETIKTIDTDHNPVCGLFCYNTSISKGAILSRFGWHFDNELEAWVETPGYDLEYPNIDFIICIASLEEDEECIEKQFFLIKDETSGRFVLRQDYPIIKNFFVVTENL